MPPVFGPWSPSRARLKSCAGSSGTALAPSASANSDTSGPSRNSSTTTFPAARAWASAAARSPVTTTPLPPASPSAFTTYGGPNSSSARATSASVSQVRAMAVGMPAAVMTSLANDFDPSIMAARRLGPKQLSPAQRVAQPGDKWCLRADDDQPGSERAGQAGHRADVGQIGGVEFGEGGDAGVARRRVQAGHVGVGGERPRQRVLAAP